MFFVCLVVSGDVPRYQDDNELIGPLALKKPKHLKQDSKNSNNGSVLLLFSMCSVCVCMLIQGCPIVLDS